MWPILVSIYLYYCTKSGQFILRKKMIIVATRFLILRLKCTKFDFGPARELTVIPRPPSWISGVLRVREGRGRGEKVKGRRRKGKAKG